MNRTIAPILGMLVLLTIAPEPANADSHVTTTDPASFSGIQYYTTGSGVYTVPTGIIAIQIECVGGGGGGGGASASAGPDQSASSGGAGGGYARKLISPVSVSYTYAVGAGGAGGSGVNDGTAGSSTTFDSITCGGGAGGKRLISQPDQGLQPGVTGGSATGGDMNVPGGSSGASLVFDNNEGLNRILMAGKGGDSVLGHGGNPPTQRVGITATGGTAGVNGNAYGGGGSGSTAFSSAIISSGDFAGGNGAAGIIIIREYEESPAGPQGPMGPPGVGGNLTLRQTYGPVETNGTFPLYATITDNGVLRDVDGDMVTIEIGRVIAETVWDDSVVVALMDHVSTGLYVYNWTPPDLGRYNIMMHGEHTNGTALSNNPIRVNDYDITEATFEPQLQFMELESDQSWTFLFFFALMLWAMKRGWPWIWGTTVLLIPMVIVSAYPLTFPGAVMVLVIAFAVQYLTGGGKPVKDGPIPSE